VIWGPTSVGQIEDFVRATTSRVEADADATPAP
jgi:hypothetical protein